MLKQAGPQGRQITMLTSEACPKELRKQLPEDGVDVCMKNDTIFGNRYLRLRFCAHPQTSNGRHMLSGHGMRATTAGGGLSTSGGSKELLTKNQRCTNSSSSPLDNQSHQNKKQSQLRHRTAVKDFQSQHLLVTSHSISGNSQHFNPASLCFAEVCPKITYVFEASELATRSLV